MHIKPCPPSIAGTKTNLDYWRTYISFKTLIRLTLKYFFIVLIDVSNLLEIIATYKGKYVLLNIILWCLASCSCSYVYPSVSVKVYVSLSDASVSAAKALCATILGNGERPQEFALTNSVVLSLSFQMEWSTLSLIGRIKSHSWQTPTLDTILDSVLWYCPEYSRIFLWHVS